MFRKWLFACAVALSMSGPAHGQVARTDYSDLWWNPAENGWGLSVQQQGDLIFAALFLYADDGSSSWYFASDVRPDGGAGQGWAGKLYRASGPVFSAPFDHAATITEVGSLRLEFSGASTGTLAYSLGNSSFSKPIERLTWRVPSIDGGYHGGLSSAVSQCTDPNFDGVLDLMGAMSVASSGTRTTLTVASTEFSGRTSRCTLSGERRQAGRVGSIAGTFSCNLVTGRDDRNDNDIVSTRNGTFVLDGIAASANGIAAAFSGVDQDCTYRGTFGGVRTQ